MYAPLNEDKLSRQMRMDLVFEAADVNEETGEMTLVMRPDPRRYTEFEEDGRRMYLDKYLGHAFSLEAFGSMGQSADRTPLFFLEPRIGNSASYANARLQAVRRELQTGEYLPPTETPYPHRNLDGVNRTIPMTFISVDVCGSTALRAAHQHAFDRALDIFLEEMGTVAGQFQGTIFKLTGDGFLAYVDHPSINSQCDAAVDLCLTLLVVLEKSVNPALREAGLPQLEIRVGAEHGDAHIRLLEVRATGYSVPDMSSDALNRSVKIQASCQRNEFRIGRRLYELIDVQWLERSIRVATLDAAKVGDCDLDVYSIA